MAGNRLAIVGRNRTAGEIFELSQEKGIPAELHSRPEEISASAPLVIETSADTEEGKKGVLRELDARLPPSAVILSSCLRFSTARIASWVSRPERVIGFATFYPIRGKALIELTRGLQAQDDSIKEAETLFELLGKKIEWVKDAPGLVFPRILSLIINEAARALDEGTADAEDIDLGMRLGTNYPMGPLRWADQVGLDEVLAVLEGLHHETGDDRYRELAKKSFKAFAGTLQTSPGSMTAMAEALSMYLDLPAKK